MITTKAVTVKKLQGEDQKEEITFLKKKKKKNQSVTYFLICQVLMTKNMKEK